MYMNSLIPRVHDNCFMLLQHTPALHSVLPYVMVVASAFPAKTELIFTPRRKQVVAVWRYYSCCPTKVTRWPRPRCFLWGISTFKLTVHCSSDGSCFVLATALISLHPRIITVVDAVGPSLRLFDPDGHFSRCRSSPALFLAPLHTSK
jgi:hypothetical protein